MPRVATLHANSRAADRSHSECRATLHWLTKNANLSDELAGDLADAVKRHWLTTTPVPIGSGWCAKSNKPLIAPRLETAKDCDSNAPPVVAPINDVSPLALRGRFKEFMRLEFTSEVLRQIQRQLESRDDRGRPLILPPDAKLIADTARATLNTLAAHNEHDSSKKRFADSPTLRQLIAVASRRVLSHQVESFDPRRPEQFLPAGAVDELIQIECQSLLAESADRPDIATAITALIEFDKATATMLRDGASDSPQFGSERRTLLFVPQNAAQVVAAEKVRSTRTLAAIVPAAVNDVLVVSEEAGVSPQSIAHWIEHQFPGVADAARRLHTRIDVKWQGLM